MRSDENILLVLGSEGEGVSKTISKFASHKVTIPPGLDMNNIGKHPYNMIDSLNVGVSTATLLYHIQKQRNESDIIHM